MPRAKRFASGFTLIEIMIVIAVIAILAAIAIPNYTDYIRRGKVSEALAQLSSMRVQMEQYFQDNRTYQTVPPAGTSCGVPMPATKYFSFNDPAQSMCDTPTTYKITAVGVAAQGMGGFAYTIDQANTKTTVMTAPSSWPSNTGCWVTRADGTC